MRKVYQETFDDGPAGWWGWISNSQGPKRLEHSHGAVTSRSPWWIDYNHAPPGGGYLHMLFCMNTTGPQGEHFREIGGVNRFIESRMPTDFTDATIEVTIRGELIHQGSQLYVLIQGTDKRITSPWVLTGQPISIAKEWSTQQVTLTSDVSQWTALGSRFDRTDMYGIRPLDQILQQVNNNIMLVLYPLEIVPMQPLNDSPHRLRPEKDYAVWRHRLPEGFVTMDDLTITFPN